ncbi:MAG: hypothetical protein ACI4PQ_05130 [Butyricicoccaceae bacterium]
MRDHEHSTQRAIGETLRTLWEKYRYFLLVVAVGIILMLTSVPGQQKAEESGQTTEAEETFRLADFEQELEQVLSQIDGAGRVQVTLSLKTGEESVYALNETRSTQNNGTDSSSENYQSEISIISDGSYGETPILIRSNYPEFRGAVVVCDGADNDQVKLDITEAVHALCGLSSDQISIIRMSQ